MFSDLRLLLSSPLDAARMADFSEAKAHAAIADKRVETSEVDHGVLFSSDNDASTTLFNRAIAAALDLPACVRAERLQRSLPTAALAMDGGALPPLRRP